jgi:hypothetical protein
VHATVPLANLPASGMPLASAWGPATAHFQMAEPTAPAMAPAEEMAHIRTTLKSRRDFAKTLHGMIAANPSDGFSSMVLATIDQDITVLNSRLDALRPPEARLNQLSGELKHKTNLHAKLVAELAALDLSRTLLQSRVQVSQEELAQMQIDFDQLKPPPTEVPGPAMAAFQQVLVNLGQGPLFDQLMSHLQGLGLNVNAGLRVEATGSPAADRPAPSPFSPIDPAAAASAAAAAAAGSPFHAAAAAATHSRAAELATAADAAQVAAAGANAQAVALAMQANHALSQAHAYQEQLQQQQAYHASAAAATAAAANGAAAPASAAATLAAAAPATPSPSTASGLAPPTESAPGAAAAAPAAPAGTGRQSRSATRPAGTAPSPRPSRSPRRPGAGRPESVDSRDASPALGLFD